MPFFKKYLNIIVFLACWNLPLSIVGTFFDFREATTYLVLIIGLVLMKSCGIDAGVEALAKYLKGNLKPLTQTQIKYETEKYS